MKTRRTIITFIKESTLFLIVFAVTAFFTEWFSLDTGAPFTIGTGITALLFLVPFFTILLIRRRVRKKWLIALGFFAVLLAMLIPPYNETLKNFALPVFLTGVIYAIVPKRKQTGYIVFDRTLPIAAVLGNLLLTLIADYLRLQTVPVMLTAFTFYVIAAAVLSIHIANADASLSLLDCAGQPVNRVLRFNNIIMAGFILLLLFGVWCAQYIPVSDILAALAALAGGVAKWVLGLFFKREAEPAEYQEPLHDLQNKSPMESVRHVQDNAGLDHVLFWLGGIITAIVLINVLIRLTRWLYERFRTAPDKEADEREFIFDMPNTSVKDRIAKVKQRLAIFDRYPAQRQRRLYYKKVKQLIKKGMPIRWSDTTDEIAVKAHAFEDIAELTALYEQARYGREAL